MKFNEFEAKTGSAILILVSKAEFIPLYTTQSSRDLLTQITSVYTQDLWKTMAIIRTTTLSNNLLHNNKPSIEVFDIGTSVPQIEFFSRGVN